MRLAAPLARTLIGSLFVGHGTQKLAGWFGGHGLDATAGAFEQMGLRPGRRHATAAGVAETLGGALMVLGAFTPAASAMLSGTMVTAIRKVHASKGPWVTNSGWEYNGVLLAALFALAEHGPGRPSVDERAMPWMKGSVWALGALGAGVAGSYLVTERLAEPAPEEAGTAEHREAARDETAHEPELAPAH